MTPFDIFVGVDWSGAEGATLKGLQAAVCEPGDGPPRLARPPGGGPWGRSAFGDWLAGLVRSRRRALVGLDFAFAYPHRDRGAYFPGSGRHFEGAFALWAEVERICGGAAEFHGGPFFRSADAPYAAYLLCPTYKGDRYQGRLRQTEIHCAREHPTAPPMTVFKCVGVSVGIGSLAGMRFLHAMRRHLPGEIAVWPFDAGERDARLVLVEAFPSLYYAMAGRRGREWTDGDTVRAVLERFSSTPAARPETKDQADALVAAAALRGLSSRARVWKAPSADGCARRFEGWIFGIE